MVEARGRSLQLRHFSNGKRASAPGELVLPAAPDQLHGKLDISGACTGSAAENLEEFPNMNGTTNERGGAAALGVLLALGLIIGGWVLGVQIKNTRLADRYVTVKGPC